MGDYKAGLVVYIPLSSISCNHNKQSRTAGARLPALTDPLLKNISATYRT